MWILRYVARGSPSGPKCTEVLRPRSAPSTRSAIEPATRSMPSSRAARLAHVSAGPSRGSAPAAVCSGVARTAHFSGSTTSSAPAAAAARVSRSAASRLRSRSPVELSCTAAALTASVLSLPWIHPSVNPLWRGYRASMRTPPPRPWRGERRSESGRPAGIPLPPARLPLVRGGRPLKRWRWVGAFSGEVMLCAASARIGGVPVSWWAVWDGEQMHERTHRRAGAVSMAPGRVRAATLDLRFEEGDGVEVVSPHGANYVWTRKQGGLAVRGTVLGRPFEGFGVVDDSAGYHARHTAWRWSAGVGVAESGARVAWNLVDGVHDDPLVSERTVWVDGAPHHLAPLAFAPDLSGVGDLRCEAVAVRARRERLLVLASDYEQPFGRFTGVLPHGGPLREGRGVMERHDVRW